MQESQSKVQTALMHICAGHSQICLQKSNTLISSERKKGRKTTPMLPLAYIKVLLHFQVDPSLYVIPKLTFQELGAPKDYCLLLMVNTLNGHKQAGWHLSKGKAPRFRQGWLKTSNSHGYPHYYWVDHRW